MKIKYYLFLVLWASLTGASIAHAAGMVDIEIGKRQEVITIEVPDTAGYKAFLIPDPNRLVVDVLSIPGKPRMVLPPAYHGDLIRGLRFGQFDPHTSRFVFDLKQPVRVADAHAEHGRLVIEITPANAVAAAMAVNEEKPVFPAPPSAGKARITNFSAGASAPQNTLDAQGKRGGHRQEKQAALNPHKIGKPLVVIDAGHGGVDPGTIGPEGTYEKNLTLAYAKTLKAKLLRTGRYQVKLTREGDTFIMLRQRVAMARAAGASLFISLHADSAPETVARGLSVYTVSEKASDKETAALAARENKADVLAGVDLSEERGDVASILISLAERDTMNRSATLADELVTSLDDKVRLLQNSHRFAGFAVLKAPDIPSVLIEIGFLSSEEKLLKSKAYRDRVTAGIAAGVDAYFTEQRRMGSL